MSFFHNLNKTLDSIAARPESAQLNERDMGKHNNATTGFKAVADKAAKEYGSKAAGERVAGAQFQKMKKAGQLEEEGMSRAAKGYEKYGKQGMEALAKAGREGKALDPVRAKYDKYDNTEVDEGMGMTDEGNAFSKAVVDAKKDGIQPGEKIRVGGKQYPVKEDESTIRDDLAYEIGMILDGALGGNDQTDSITDDLGDMFDDIEDSGDRAAMMAYEMMVDTIDTDARTQANAARQALKLLKNKSVNEKMSPGKAKSFAALAPPKDKITFADKIAGAKKEVDEMLGDVAAEAMKKAIGGYGEKIAETQGATTYTVAYKDPSKPGKSYSTQVKATSAAEAKAAFQEWNHTDRFVYLGSRPDVDTVYEADKENAFTAHKRPRAETPKVGTVTHGSKHDVEEIPGGRRVTRRTDAAGISVGADDGQSSSDAPRGRGRPKGPAKAPERVTGGATKHKDGRKVKEAADQGQTQQIYDELADIRAVAKQAQRGGEFPQGFASRLESVLYAAMTLIKNQQAGNAQVSEEELDEKAVSKKQQKFMGMVHAAQKGEKPASKEVAKVAKEMPKKAAKDFAATKHKGLPEKKKPEAKDKKEESVEDKPSKSSSKFKFGGSVYENLDTQLETLINESMNVSVNMATADNGQDDHSITVTASGEDAMALAQLLKSAGLTQSSHEGCSACGQSECGCEQMDENSPNWPTNTETSNNALQYAGGLNKPKSTGQTTTPVIASQLRRQVSMEESVKIERNLFDLYKNFTK
jgi:hypothetical protein